MDTRYAWDDNGSVTLLHADGSQEVYVHDPQARLVQRVDPDGGKHFKSYDAQGPCCTPMAARKSTCMTRRHAWCSGLIPMAASTSSPTTPRGG
ncbi:hypothetical protein [Pseudomonas sp. ICMP 8385]|uniref:hypothetical protein n=1 Tax=Pseudomonas sp. ICMP 8385 TaxID=1718920 RepID=UPI00211D9F18|nr:hypothetical protein [Pseudomonas sp. ICMP 8385]